MQLACSLFTQALAILLGGGATPIPSRSFTSSFPYFITIITLVLFVGKSVAPKADGVPYIKEAVHNGPEVEGSCHVSNEALVQLAIGRATTPMYRTLTMLLELHFCAPTFWWPEV